MKTKQNDFLELKQISLKELRITYDEVLLFNSLQTLTADVNSNLLKTYKEYHSDVFNNLEEFKSEVWNSMSQKLCDYFNYHYNLCLIKTEDYLEILIDDNGTMKIVSSTEKVSHKIIVVK